MFTELLIAMAFIVGSFLAAAFALSHGNYWVMAGVLAVIVTVIAGGSYSHYRGNRRRPENRSAPERA